MPYTTLAPETKAAVEPYAPTLAWTGWGEEAYADLLESVWASGTDVILVEHDVVPAPGVLDEMWACERDWCAVPYRCGTVVTTALGCTKFSAALRHRNPDTINRIQQRAWFNLDSQIVYTLHQHGESEHLHGPQARHMKYDRGDPYPPPMAPTQRRRALATRLLYVGNGTKYLNGVPAADFETDDPGLVAICLASGLYMDASMSKAKRAAAPPAAPSGAPANTSANEGADEDAASADVDQA